MSASKFTKAEQFQLITECRASGLSDYAWCKQNNIQPGTFYGWVRKFRREACAIPESSSKSLSATSSVPQEVVRLDFHPEICNSSYVYPEQNACIESKNSEHVTIMLEVGSMHIKIANDVDPLLLSTLFQALGGVAHAR